MSISVQTLAVAKKYTDDSLAGAGAVAGVPCQIQSITEITGGHRVTFLWLDNNGDSHTSTMDVMNGQDGQPGAPGAAGVGISKIEKTSTSGLIDTYTITFTNNTTQTYDVTNGAPGQDGTDGEGVPTGGTQGQVLAKKSGTDFDTEWVTPSAGATVDTELSTTSENPVQNKVITTELNKKVDAVSGKGLSTEDFTSVEKAKLSGIEDGAEVNVQSNWSESDDTKADFIKNKPTLGTAAAKDSTNAVTENSSSLVESGAVFTGLVAKADKVSGATNGNLAALDANGNLTDSGKKPSDFLTQHQDISGKADKVTSAIAGDFAALDANGNLTDSGKKASDFATAQGLADEAATRSAMGAKNLFNNNMTSETIADEVTFTVNADKTVTAQITTTLTAGRNIHGTMTIPAGTYIYSGCPSGGSGSTYQMTFYSNTDQRNLATDRGEGAEFTIDKTHFVYVYLDLKVGLTPQTLLFKPMVRFATDADDTYRPYVPANKNLLSQKDNAILGARNLLFHRGTMTTQGVRFESDDDGVITVTRQSANANHAYYNKGRFTLKPGTYIFSNGYDSLPSGIQATYLYNHTDGVYFTNCNNGPKTFTLTEEKRFAFNVEVQSSQSPSGVKIYPMIRLATDDDKTFSPITMTNQELTKIGTLKTISVTVNSNFATDGTLSLPSVYIGGGYWLCAYQPIHIKAGIDISSLISGHANVITFPSGYTSGLSVKAYHFINDDTRKGMFQLANRWGSDGIQFYAIDSELNTYIKESSADLYMATQTSFIMLRETT